ncbi:helix-turn-helix domain-containing protein [Intrasporangium sp. DVR]|uniref:helix-turn-helix domain-containing protein n=1 Tax=Intrasporangium sp. DVR TaxID=3127867 RepID=UPI00313A6139
MTTTTAVESVLTVRDVARHLGCRDEETVYRLIHRGDLRAIRVGRLVRVPESALRDFIAGR